MFKKKRVFYLAVLALAVFLALRYGLAVSGGFLLLFLAMLALLHAWHLATAHRGMDRLKQHKARYGYEMAISTARGRLTDGCSSFVVLGDSRNSKRVAGRVYSRAASENPAAVFHTGDIVRHGTPAEFLRNHVPLLEAIAPVPMIPVPGNHDRGARRDCAAFRELHGDTRFAFALGDCRFIGFNNSGRARVDTEGMAWLEEELRVTARHKFVFFHVPPAFFEERFVTDTRRRGFKTMAGEVHHLFRETGVTEVFTSHIHGFASADIDGVRYTLTAGAGAPLSRRVRPEDRSYHYLLLTVAPEGGLRREIVRMAGDTWRREPY